MAVFVHSIWRGYRGKEHRQTKPISREFMRDDFRLRFQAMITELATVDDLRRHAVGYGLNFMTTGFVATFGSLSSFKALPYADQMDYLKKLFAAAEGLVREDPEVALGFRLFGMYMTAQIENDREVISEVGAQLAPLCKEGDLGML